MKTDAQYTELARTIYLDLKTGIGSIVDWRLGDRYDVAVFEIGRIIQASNGHLRNRNGIVEVVK